MIESQRVVMTADEQKSVMLNILSEFDLFCSKHDLNYFLDAGTLLGAVRHHGFIPWDDDIDVNMPRRDYDQFCQMVKENNGYLTDHLFVEFSEDTIFPFIKIVDDRTILVEYPESNPMEVAVYIDVFPKDGIKGAGALTRGVCKISYLLNLWRWFNVFSVYAWKNSSNRLKRLMSILGRPFANHPNLPLKLQQKWIRWNNKRNPLKECSYVTTLVNGEFHKKAPKDCFEDYILMEFEGKKFRAPVDYDTYLRCLYPGDYMQLPPVEQRYKHDTIVFWKSHEDKTNFTKS